MAMKGLQSRRRKDCLPGRPSRARNRFASWSPEMVVACCITIDRCIVTDSEQGEAGRDTTPPGGAGSQGEGLAPAEAIHAAALGGVEGRTLGGRGGQGSHGTGCKARVSRL